MSPPTRPASRQETPSVGWRTRTNNNLAALGISKGIAAVVALVVTAYLTRTLGPHAFGILGFGTALLSYFVLFVRLGFPVLATREIARDPSNANALAGQFLGMQLVLACVGLFVYTIIVLSIPKPAPFQAVLLIQGIGLIAHATSLEWLFLGLDRTWELASRNIASSFLHLGPILLLVHSPDDVTLAAAASVASLVMGSGWLLLAAIRAFGRLTPRMDGATWKAHLKPALPIAASTFLIAIYYNLDQVMLGFMRSETEVGWYAAGYKGVTAALIPAIVIAQSYFPSLSVVRENSEATRERMIAYARAMLLVGIPLAVGATMFARPILVLFAGAEFEPASGAFLLLMVNVGVVYLNMIYGQPLLAWDRQAVYMYMVGGGAVMNIILNILLIPPMGIHGAALATLSSEAAVLIGIGYQHRRITQSLYGGLVFRTMVASAFGVALPAALYQLEVIPFWPALTVTPFSFAICAGALGLSPLSGGASAFRNSFGRS